MTLRIRIDQAETTLNSDDLPVTLGSSTDARFAVPANDRFLLSIDRDEHGWQLSASGIFATVRINDLPLSRVQRLVDGDLVTVDDTSIRFVLADGLDVTIDTQASTLITAPPVEIAAATDGDSLVAAAYERQREVGGVEVKRGFGWKGAVAAALLVLGSIAATLFTAQSVRIETVPETVDHVAISGGWMKLKVGDRYLLRPGTHRIELRSQGYRDLQDTFELTRDEPLTLRLEQEPLPGALIVQTEPVATVKLGEAIEQAAPARIDNLLPGRYLLSASAPGYLDWQGEVMVTGREQTDHLMINLVPAYARVTLATNPTGAKVLSRQKELGTTDDIVKVPEGRQTLVVALDGYKPEEVDVELIANTDVTLDSIELTRADGTLRVASRPTAANVSVDGNYRGQTPVTLSLSPGQTYVVQLSKAGYGRVTRQVEVASATGDELLVDLNARLGSVELDVRPGDATIYINGRQQGADRRQFELPASPQRIEVRKAGYETWRETITPRPGFPQRVAVRLRSGDQVRVAAIDSKLTSSRGPVLRYVDRGEFTMGASRREPGRRANETLRKVVLSDGFYIGTREITNAEFRLFKSDHDSSSNGPVTLAGDRNPVVNVTWQEAAAYCNWLSAQDGLDPVYEDKFDRLVAIRPFPNGYRLPTEAEWAWAARYQGGKGFLKFPWGEKYPPEKESGNYADLASNSILPTWIPGYNDGFESTAPVATFPANRAGLHDLGGNVAEWVNDLYQVYTPDSSRVWTNPLGPEQAKHNVIRGASWRSGIEATLRYSYRDFGDKARSDVGFRIARNKP